MQTATSHPFKGDVMGNMQTFEKIVEERKNGKTYAELSKEFGVSSQLVCSVMKMCGLNKITSVRPRRSRRKKREDVDGMAKMKREGSSLQEIGDTYNLSRERVRQLLKQQFPEEMFKRKQVISEKAEKALKLFREGERRMWVIAEKCGYKGRDGAIRYNLSRVYPEFLECQTKGEYEKQNLNERYRELVKRGLSIAQIVREVGRPYPRVFEDLSLLGLKAKDGRTVDRNEVRKEQIKVIKKGLKEGKSIYRIAKENKWTQASVGHIKRKFIDGEKRNENNI